MKDLLHKLFYAEIKKQAIGEISPEELIGMGIKVVALDADNTSSFDRTTKPLPGTEDWIKSLKGAGLKVVLLSNAKTERAKVLADIYDIPVIGMSCKPLPFGYMRAVLKFRTKPQHICMIGDQLFTDILGANICGFKSIYVFPYEKEKRNSKSFAVKRFAEKLIFAYQYKKYN